MGGIGVIKAQALAETLTNRLIKLQAIFDLCAPCVKLHHLQAFPPAQAHDVKRV
jgi:hypothetical protein